MNRLTGWWTRVGRALRPARFDAEMEVEMKAHRQMEADALQQQGLDPATAGRLAAVRFGSAEAYKETVRDRRLGRWLHEFLRDARYAFRQLRNAPGFAAIAIATLALGIAASTAIISAIDGVLFRPMPYPDPERLVLLMETLPGNQINNASGGAFLDWRTHQTSFEGIALTSDLSRNVRHGRHLERVHGTEVTHEFFSIFGISPLLGRTFGPTEDQPGPASQVLVITEGYWRARFAASPSALGQTVLLDEVPHTVVGVVPDDFIRSQTRFYVPAVAVHAEQGPYSRTQHWAVVVGRLKAGVSMAQAEAELKAIKAQLASSYPTWKKDWSVAVRAPRPLITEDTRPVVALLGGAVVIVLLIACANVANLLLARAARREQEIALRGALGASSSRIARQVLTESIVLALLGGLSGVLLAAWAIDLLRAATATTLPPALAPQMDLRVLTLALLVSVVTGILFGTLPALRTRRLDLHQTLKDGGRSSTAGRTRAQSWLIIAEVALSVVLLSAAGLLLKSLATVVAADPGFEPERVLAFDLSLPATSYPTPESRLQFSNTLREAMRQVPGVESVGTGLSLPFAGGGYGEMFCPGDRTPSYDDPGGRVDFVSPDYLPTLGARLLAGRWMTEQDNRPDSPSVGLVNDVVARQLFPGALPVGKTVIVNGKRHEIIGVIASLPNLRKDEPAPLFLYAPQARSPDSFSVVVRARGRPEQLTAGLRGALERLDPGLPMGDLRTLDQAMNRSLSLRRIVLALIASFAGACLLLASIGLYGVMAYSVNTRRRELSVRLALGADRWDMLRLVLADGLKLTAGGLLLGLVLTLFVTRMLEQHLFGVSALDPWVIGLTLLLLLGVALFACWWPALRATREDALGALRAEC